MERKTGIVIYGLGDAECCYRVLRYYTMLHEDVGVTPIYRAMRMLKAECPGIHRFYMIDNYRGLRRDYLDAKRMNSMESWAMFKDILERGGVVLQF